MGMGSLMKSWVLFPILLTRICSVQAHDYGQHGHVFPIAEPDLLTTLHSRLQHLNENEGLAKLQEQQIQQAQKSRLRPHVVVHVARATITRRWHHDPSLTLRQDIQDHHGHIMHKAGIRINPLHHRPMTKTLVFINGDDAEQCAWYEQHYLKNLKSKAHKIILVNGAPFTLMEQWQQPVYFDQHSRLVQKFSIEHVPATITALGDHFIIEEINIGTPTP